MVVHKRRSPSGGGVPIADEGVLQKRTSKRFVAKQEIFRKLWCVRTDKERSPLFYDFVRAFFMDGQWPLIIVRFATDTGLFVRCASSDTQCIA